MSDERLYTEKEVSTIFKRAGELSSDEPEKDAYGLTLEELKQIGTEVGIDPAKIALAAAELDLGQNRKGPSGKILMPVSLEVDRVISGEISPDQWPEIAHRIGKTFGLVGTSDQVGRTLEWTHMDRRTQFQITVTPGEGRTRIRVNGKFWRAAVASLAPVMVVALFLGSTFPLWTGPGVWPISGLPLFVLSIVFGYALARILFGGFIDRRRKKIDELITYLQGLASAPEEKASDAAIHEPQHVPDAISPEQTSKVAQPASDLIEDDMVGLQDPSMDSSEPTPDASKTRPGRLRT